MRPATQIPRNSFVLILALVVVVAPEGVRAQIADPDETGLVVDRSRESGRATFVTSGDGAAIVTKDAGGVASAIHTPEQFLDRLGRLFGVIDRATQLRAVSVDVDLLGHSHTKFKQWHRGVAVFGGQIRVHQDDQGNVYAANGHFPEVSNKFDVRPALSIDMALDRARAEFEVAKPHVHRAELTIVDPGWYGDPPLGARLVYHIELEDVDSFFAEAFFVDANTGKVLDRWSLVEQARNRQIYNGNNTRDLPGFLVRSEFSPGVVEPIDANRAFHFYGDTYDYFWRAFGRDSMDNRGIAMVATVNSLAPGCPNAFWSSSRKQMAFCLGTVTDDITAHELTHGLTFFSAELVYQNQSGMLNESFSDVFGELVDLFNGNAAFPLVTGGAPWPTHATGPGLDELNSLRSECSPRTQYFDGVRWLIGEDAFAFGGSLRDMWDPTCHYDPDRGYSPYNTCGPGDNGGVHSGSGIPNHAFAILVDGKDFNGYSVRGIGPIKAGAVWYRALTTYLNPMSDFEDAYLAFTQSAQDLMGTFPLDPRTGFPSNQIFSRDDVQQVDLALRAVEMDGPGRCGQTIPIVRADPPPQCGSERLIFSDDFEGGVEDWTLFHDAPLDPYDWKLVETNLPYGRTGTVFHCKNTTFGDCLKLDESGLHSLISPTIVIPREVDRPLVRFTHHIDVETGFDGGALRVRVNGERWRSVRGSNFNFNPYNTVLRSSGTGSTNPLASVEAWSGIGGEWGTSVVDLCSFASGGDVIELRFDFGKDGCVGRAGWFIDDVAVFGCDDCNANDHPDHLELNFQHTSGAMRKIGVNSPQTYVLENPPLPSGDVTLAVYAVADLTGELQDESLFVSFNGVQVAEVFASGARDCPSTPDRDEILIPHAQFRQAALEGAITIGITASDSVNPTLCGGTSWVRVDLEYETTSLDANHNDIPDECEGCEVHEISVPVLPRVAMNRYIEFEPVGGTRSVAYRVRRSLPETAASLTTVPLWVGPVAQNDDESGVSRLRCSPHFSTEWGTSPRLLIQGEFVIPGASYEIDVIDLGCWLKMGAAVEALERIPPALYYSEPLTVHTASKWGDVTGAGGAGPDGVVDMADVSAVVDRFVNAPGAIDLIRADLTPATPDGVVDFTDISAVINAYRGQTYPFASQPPQCGNGTR